MALEGLAKATIVVRGTADRIEVMYNPEEYKLDQGNSFAEIGVPGLESPPIQYVRGRARTLAMELFFDTFEAATDVRDHTARIVKLLDKLPETHAPPVLLFSMGTFQFECVLVDVAQRYTMFTRTGMPVRATLSVRFQEYARTDVEIERGLFIGPPALHNIGAGETVSDLAAQFLGDPARWREIADANQVADPLRLQAGSSVVIPRESR